MPTGIAVRQARKKAANTRYRLQKVCSSNVAPPKPSVATSRNCASTAAGDGRNRGLIQPLRVTNHQSRSSASTVTTLIATLEPWPG